MVDFQSFFPSKEGMGLHKKIFHNILEVLQYFGSFTIFWKFHNMLEVSWYIESFIITASTKLMGAMNEVSFKITRVKIKNFNVEKQNFKNN